MSIIKQKRCTWNLLRTSWKPVSIITTTALKINLSALKNAWNANASIPILNQEWIGQKLLRIKQGFNISYTHPGLVKFVGIKAVSIVICSLLSSQKKFNSRRNFSILSCSSISINDLNTSTIIRVIYTH